jgi:RES domain-containing protein
MPQHQRIELWRAFVPRWSYLPLSGEGATRFGGRWNPVGAPTIYAARELSTAWAEYNQGFVQHPAIIARLDLVGATLIDLNNPGVMSGLGLKGDLHRCEWRAIVASGEIPETYLVRERLIAGGADGVIFPSHMSPGGTCVALWRWNVPGGPVLELIDPEDRLPKTPASWV